MALKFCQARKTTLAVPLTSTETSKIVLRSLVDSYGTQLTFTDFGDLGLMTIAPGTDNEEIVSFGGFTVETNGNVTIDTSITRALLGKSPYGAGGTARSHAAGTEVVFSNNPQMYEALKDYIDSVAIAGAPDASATGKGIVEIATSSEIDSETATGSTGAVLAISPDQFGASKWGVDYVTTSSGAGDSGKVVKLDANGKIPQAFLEGTFFDQQTFSVTGTWTKPTRGSLALVELWGAGGSGGAANDQGGSNGASAAGGGGGEYVSFIYPITFFGATEIVTIGTGGVAKTQTGEGATAGAAGVASSFGSYATANGGSGGAALSASSSVSSGGAGGTGGSVTGVIQLKIDTGGTGGDARGYYNPTTASAGGNNDWGGGGGGGAAHGEGYPGSPATGIGGTSTNGGAGGAGAYNTNATDGSVKGGGGGGADSNSPTVTSGAGGNGYCRVTIF